MSRHFCSCPLPLPNKLQIRDSLEGELAKADELIARADAALGDFDAKFQAVETESETAKEHAQEVDRLLEEARDRLVTVQQKAREEGDRRTELQVGNLPRLSPEH